MEFFPVVGSNGYEDKETGAWIHQPPMYCANPRWTEESEIAASSYAASGGSPSSPESLHTVIWTGQVETGEDQTEENVETGEDQTEENAE